MMVGKESINVVVCGPKGSGKSSIIAAFVTDHFPESVQFTMPEVNIPPEENEDGTQARQHYQLLSYYGTGIATENGMVNTDGVKC